MIGGDLARVLTHQRFPSSKIWSGARRQACASAIWARTATSSPVEGRDDSAMDGSVLGVDVVADKDEVVGAVESGAEVPAAGAGARVVHAPSQATIPLPASTAWPSRHPSGRPASTRVRSCS